VRAADPYGMSQDTDEVRACISLLGSTIKTLFSSCFYSSLFSNFDLLWWLVFQEHRYWDIRWPLLIGGFLLGALWVVSVLRVVQIWDVNLVKRNGLRRTIILKDVIVIREAWMYIVWLIMLDQFTGAIALTWNLHYIYIDVIESALNKRHDRISKLINILNHYEIELLGYSIGWISHLIPCLKFKNDIAMPYEKKRTFIIFMFSLENSSNKWDILYQPIYLRFNDELCTTYSI
jgi:hypothetical protein